jgi:transcriptional regulator with XRE-family HTH domain
VLVDVDPHLVAVFGNLAHGFNSSVGRCLGSILKVSQLRTYRYDHEDVLSRTGSLPILNFEVDDPTALGSAMTLGEKIKKLRREKSYTLERLGELTDSSKSYIWELENKNPPRPSAEKIAKIAAVLGVTADFLMDVEETEPAADVVDQAFFRKYRKMQPGTKQRIRRLVDIWDDEL